MVSFTCVFVSCTLIFTGLASLFLTVSLISNGWEFISYNLEKVEAIAKAKNHSVAYLGSNSLRIETETETGIELMPNKSNGEMTQTFFYLLPAHGGVNALCVDLEDEELSRLRSDGYEIEECISYLATESIISKDAWLDRMRNLAMSCAIVSLILLACSGPLGILGLIKKQISTIMVTGVMYILAAVFGIFTLAFMYFKRVKPEGFYTSTILDRGVPVEYLKTRLFTVGWASSMGWTGLSICLFASVLWLLLAKIMRFQMLSPT